MPISYDQTVNDLTILGYSEAAPCSFTDLHNADLAAVNGRTLFSATAPGSPWTASLTSQPQPCEQLAVPLKVACTPRAGASLVLTGTDAWGAAQSETVDLSSGTAATGKRWRSVNANGLQVTGLNSGDSFAVHQDRWGVVWRFGNVFLFDARLTVGDDTPGNKGHLADTRKTAVFNQAANDAGYPYCIQLKRYSYLRLGEAVSLEQKTVRHGCTLINLKNLSGTHWTIRKTSATDITVLLYDSTCRYQGPSAADPFVELRCSDSDDQVRVWHCHFSHTRVLQVQADKGSFFDVLVTGGSLGFGGGGVTERLSVHGQSSAALYLEGAARTIRNVFSRGAANLVRAYNFANAANILDADTDTWGVSWHNSGGRINRQYTLNLAVSDALGFPLPGATVTLTDKNGSQVFSQVTGAEGQIPTQVVTRGYYEQATGSTLQDYGPHSLTITRDGYETYRDVLTIAARLDLDLALSPAAGPVYIPVPAEKFSVEFSSPVNLEVMLSSREIAVDLHL